MEMSFIYGLQFLPRIYGVIIVGSWYYVIPSY